MFQTPKSSPNPCSLLDFASPSLTRTCGCPFFSLCDLNFYSFCLECDIRIHLLGLVCISIIFNRSPTLSFYAIIYGFGILTFVSVVVCSFLLGVKKSNPWASMYQWSLPSNLSSGDFFLWAVTVSLSIHNNPQYVACPFYRFVHKLVASKSCV